MADKSLRDPINHLMQTSSVADLPYQHVTVTGADAFDFLQGQLTLDLNNIDESTCLPAGYCNHKGQLFGVLWLYKQHDVLHFFIHEAVANNVIQRLNMFVLRSDVTLTPFSQPTLVVTPAKAQQLSDDLPQAHGERRGQFVRIGYDVHYFLQFAEEVQAEAPETAYALPTCTGVVDIIGPTYEKLLPFQCGLGDLGGISYDKGCYVGQEVIAINKYRGRNDKHLTLAILERKAETNFASGDMLRDDEGKALGVITDFAHTDTHLYLQVIMSERTIGSEITLLGQRVTFEPIFTQTESNN